MNGLGNSFHFLLLMSENIRHMNDILDDYVSHECVFTDQIKSYYSFANNIYNKKRVEWTKAIYNWNWNKTIPEEENVKLFLSKFTIIFQFITIDMRFGAIPDEEQKLSVDEAIDFVLAVMSENASSLSETDYTSHLIKLLYQDYQKLALLKDVEEMENQLEEPSLPELVNRITEDSTKLKDHLRKNPIGGYFAPEVLKYIIGAGDVAFDHDSALESIAEKYSIIIRKHYMSTDPEELVGDGAFSIDLNGLMKLDIFTWFPSLSIGYLSLGKDFILERIQKSFDIFVPGSNFYSMQKVSLPVSFKLGRGYPEQEDYKIEYPTFKDILLKLKDSQEYVTDDFDWKVCVLDYKADTFYMIHYKLDFSHIPRSISDYCFCFGSKHLGWSSTDTINIIIVTDRRHRYLTKINNNITMFAAPDPNVTLRYLLMYIQQNISLKLLPDSDKEIEEIQKHIRLYSKLTATEFVRGKELDINMKLLEVRELVNPGFDKSTRHVDFICYLKHPKNPLFTKYRSKEEQVLEHKLEHYTVDSIKLDSNSLLNHIMSRAMDKDVCRISERPYFNGVAVQNLMPLYLLFDVRLLNDTLIDCKTGFRFSYLNGLLSHLNLYLSCDYKLKGIICEKNGITYPCVVSKDGSKIRSFQTGKLVQFDFDTVSDRIIRFLFLERVPVDL